MYKIVYLPIAKKDLINIIDYITNTLGAPKAALDMIDAFDYSISRLKRFPNSCKVYQPIKPLDSEYRVLPVKNYLVFYTVHEQEIEIRRILYAKMNIDGLI